jgi:hypothetical protein
VIGAWKKWSGILATSVERDFERKVLPFLHLFWPGMIQTPAKSAWDAKGIDLLVWSDTEPLPCVVQCKGFAVHALGDDQLRQTLESIESFRRAGVRADTYLIVHNREGKNRKFTDLVEKQLQVLVSDGLVGRAELWDRHAVLDRAHDKLRETIIAQIHSYSQRLLDEFQSRFKFGHLYKPSVPVVEKTLRFKRFQPCEVTIEKPQEHRSVSALIISASRARWTLLAGRFGTGKTTSALHAAASSRLATLVIRCSALPPDTHKLNSTNMLLQESLKIVRLLDDIDPLEREIIYELAGTTMARLLRGPNPQYLLIFDGLDENRLYSSLHGMQWLSNQLAELRCPVVLTTRVEHLHVMFGDFSLAFEELSWRSSTKTGRLFELEAWDDDDVRAFVVQVRNETMGKERVLLDDLLHKLGTPAAKMLYGELPSNPLFLQFILEDIVSEGMQRSSRGELIDRWCRRKMLRDRSISERSSAGQGMDGLDAVERMLRVMENVAHEMTAIDGPWITLAESTTSAAVISVARSIFDERFDVLPILLNSLLMPVGPRGSNLQITFAFRILHEYFLARYVQREGLSDTYYPDTVRSFIAEERPSN